MDTFTKRKIGLLTSGGEAPGYNAAVQRIVEVCACNGIQVIGFEKSWKGFIMEDRRRELTLRKLGKIAKKPGTVLGSCRDLRIPNMYMPALVKVFHLEYDMLIAIGGDGTTRQCKELWEAGLKVNVIPSSIDGMPGTYAIGLDSAIRYNVNAAKRLVYHADAMERVLVYQAMGRDRNDIAIGVAKKTGFPLILSMDDLGKCPVENYVGKVIITSEKLDVKQVVDKVKERGVDCRAHVAGYSQRVANVTKYDLDMAQGMAEKAMQAYLDGISGVLVCYENEETILRPLSEVHY
jgi:6-phosphofructokinase 1